MKFIGITGGVGCGKSMVLRFLESEYHAYIIYSDKLAEELCAPGGECLSRIKELIPSVFPKNVIDENGAMDRAAMAETVFNSKEARNVLNGIIHPAVKRRIIDLISEKRSGGQTELLVLEAALLVEEGYKEICDELWYIYAPESERRERLKEHRGYSDGKIDSVMASQLSEEEFRANCDVVIDNFGSKEDCYEKLRVELDRLLA
ncbi:MAG: dephospho-CoA kinase [Lachnospiraceae bacterium]|nr:dephospho-CoA kinase [Lachnospiraceae bacterium]